MADREGDHRVAITGGDVVTARDRLRADVLIEGERVAAIGEIGEQPGAETVDATGCYVIPGAVDVHTHLDMEVGTTRSSDDFTSGTIAAACGGTTTVVDFATTYRGECLGRGLANWHSKAEGKAAVDYAFHMSLTELVAPAPDVVDEMAEAGITSFKLYMTYPERLMVSDDVIFEMLKAAGERGALVCLHCEDNSTVERMRQEMLARGRTEPVWHARSRPAAAEADAVERAVRMVEEAGAPCYIVHLSSGDALARVREARDRGLPVFAETCPQYLYLSADRYEDIPDRAARYVCAPPLREGREREELWEGLKRGYVEVVATDHCPFTDADKKRGLSGNGWRDFRDIPGGVPGIETRLALIYQKVEEGLITLSEWIDWCCTAPAKLFGLHPRKGDLVLGSDADIVVFDPRAERPLVPERLHMNVDYSPYEDITVRGWPSRVFARGRLVAVDGEPRAEAGWGRYLHRGPSGAPA
jgi:dihydropyrimidinase